VPAVTCAATAAAQSASASAEAQPARQRGGIDGQSAARRQVHHVEGQHESWTARQHLADEHQVARQVARVGDDDDSIGCRSARAVEHGAGDGGFRGRHVEVVDPGQIEHLERQPVGVTVAGAHRSGRAGEVRRLGAGAAQRVEERGLAGVRVADEGDAAHGSDGCRDIDRGREHGRRHRGHMSAAPSGTT
jgi:hypothetical protein